MQAKSLGLSPRQRAVATSFRSRSALASTSLLKYSLNFLSFSVSRESSVSWRADFTCSAVPEATAAAASADISELRRRDLARARLFMMLRSLGEDDPLSASRSLSCSASRSFS